MNEFQITFFKYVSCVYVLHYNQRDILKTIFIFYVNRKMEKPESVNNLCEIFLGPHSF